jgi:hypothetical protein
VGRHFGLAAEIRGGSSVHSATAGQAAAIRIWLRGPVT